MSFIFDTIVAIDHDYETTLCNLELIKNSREKNEGIEPDSRMCFTKSKIENIHPAILDMTSYSLTEICLFLARSCLPDIGTQHI